MKAGICVVLALVAFIAPCKSLKVAVCLFGLTRSLQYTLNNIRSNIFDPLSAAGYEHDVFLHTYNASHIYNPVVGEVNVELDWEKFMLLQPKSYQVDDMAIVDRHLFAHGLDEYLAFDGKSFWHNIGGDRQGEMTLGENITVMNMVKALWSAQQCTRLVKASLHPPDALVYLRSDVWFFNSLNASIFSHLEPNRLYVPDWAHAGGLNDRFALGLPDVAMKWGNRIDMLKEFCKVQDIMSEQFLNWAMIRQQVDISGRVDIFFERVRANGRMTCCDAGMENPCQAIDECGGRPENLRHYKAVKNLRNFVELQAIDPPS